MLRISTTPFLSINFCQTFRDKKLSLSLTFLVTIAHVELRRKMNVVNTIIERQGEARISIWFSCSLFKILNRNKYCKNSIEGAFHWLYMLLQSQHKNLTMKTIPNTKIQTFIFSSFFAFLLDTDEMPFHIYLMHI